MNFTLFVTALLTGLAFVGVVTILAKLISPRSYNAQKEETYECGIPTRGRSWMQFRVGYYLFAPAANKSSFQRKAQASISSLCSGKALILGIRMRLNRSSIIFGSFAAIYF